MFQNAVSWQRRQSQFAGQGVGTPQKSAPLTPELSLIAEKIVFAPAIGQCSYDVVSALRKHIVGRSLEVIEQSNVDLIHADHVFSFSGYLDQTNIAQMGKILVPSTMLVVRVTMCATDWQQKAISAPGDDDFVQ